MPGSVQGIFSQLTKLPSATADSDAQVGLGIRPSFTKPSLSGHFLYTGRWGQFLQLLMRISKKKILGLILLLIFIVGLVTPQEFNNPVDGADKNSYNSKSFWFYPWGKSGTHKGVDIFAKEGTSVNSSTGGLVIFTGEIKLGGKVVLIIGPKWRLHYYAHLRDIGASFLSWTDKDEKIGTVGTTGNAKGKSPHLHYSIVTLVPYPWRIDKERQGWKKMFYLNPINYLAVSK